MTLALARAFDAQRQMTWGSELLSASHAWSLDLQERYYRQQDCWTDRGEDLLSNLFVCCTLETLASPRFLLTTCSLKSAKRSLSRNVLARRKGRPKGDLEVDPNDVAAGLPFQVVLQRQDPLLKLRQNSSMIESFSTSRPLQLIDVDIAASTMSWKRRVVFCRQST